MADLASLPSATQVQELLLQAPFHRWLNLEVESLSKENIVLRATGRSEWFNSDDHPVVHGGIIAALLDIAADWALLGYGIKPSPTIDQTVNYLRPALDLDLTVVGRVIKPGRTISIAEATVFAGGKEVAISRASYATAATKRDTSNAASSAAAASVIPSSIADASIAPSSAATKEDIGNLGGGAA